uniref:Uncharacterized protein n=1 Tax=Arundo donax TaxID=35708 RepID=A0A0A9TZK5_ARUDO
MVVLPSRVCCSVQFAEMSHVLASCGLAINSRSD